jgi:hypothetical protein
MNNKRSKLSIDRLSFQLGMINCFVEMVACGVKKLALSPPLKPEDYTAIRSASDEMVQGFGIYSYLEKTLMITKLQDKEFTRNKWSILYYIDKPILDEYQALKNEQKDLMEKGLYDESAEIDISRRFMRLLSYPDSVIEEKLQNRKSGQPFILVGD